MRAFGRRPLWPAFLSLMHSPGKNLPVSCLEVKTQLPSVLPQSRRKRTGVSEISLHISLNPVFSVIPSPASMPCLCPFTALLVHPLQGLNPQFLEKVGRVACLFGDWWVMGKIWSSNWFSEIFQVILFRFHFQGNLVLSSLSRWQFIVWRGWYSAFSSLPLHLLFVCLLPGFQTCVTE